MGASSGRGFVTVEREPTADQERILTAGDRIRVVRAAPGSGKTWLIAEAVRAEHQGWQDRGGGIAALSFTNVARDEIQRALGTQPHHPHTVRTLDSFLFRYVVRPFLPAVWPGFRKVRLIPAQQVDFVRRPFDRECVIAVPGASGRRASILKFSFTGEEDGVPLLSAPMGWGESKVLTVQQSDEVYTRKREFWKRTNCVSHSDVAFLASRILSRQGRSWLEPVLNLLTERFPVFIVDELQDTGWFRGQALVRLLERPEVRGLLVGDPDQAIFEFAGASPEVFYEFENLPGARVFEMEESIRCPARVCDVARQLGSRGRDIRPRHNGLSGEAFLLPHDGTTDGLVNWLERAPLGSSNTRLCVVARKNSTLAKIRGEPSAYSPKYHSRPINHLDKAVRAFRRHDNPGALLSASAVFSEVLFGDGMVPEGGYETLGITEFEWRRQCIALLLRANEEARDRPCWEWGCRMIDELRETVERLGWMALAPTAKTPRKPSKSMDQSIAWPPERREEGVQHLRTLAGPLTFKTIHKSKGETHDVTVLFVPEPPKSQPEKCPSAAWFDPGQGGGEERRVGYVAATRAAGWFVMAVSNPTLDRLRSECPEFVRRFNVLGGFSDLPTQLPERPHWMGNAPSGEKGG